VDSARTLCPLRSTRPASIRTIEKNGGVLESIVTVPDGDKPKRRYWIAAAD